MTRGLTVLALTATLGLSAARAAADEPKLPDVKAFDKLVVDALRDVHNKGADLYNTAEDHAGAYRMYQGALLAVRAAVALPPAEAMRPPVPARYRRSWIERLGVARLIGPSGMMEPARTKSGRVSSGAAASMLCPPGVALPVQKSVQVVPAGR